jgi:hypothetical protein
MSLEQLKKEIIASQHPAVFGYLDQSHVPKLTKALCLEALKYKNKKINPKCHYEKQKVYGMVGPVLCRKK